MQSPLITHEYFFPVCQVVAEPNFPADANPNSIDFDISVNTPISKENEHIFQTSVEVKSKPQKTEDGEESVTSYKIYLVAIGVFEVDPSWPDPQKLASITGSSIL